MSNRIIVGWLVLLAVIAVLGCGKPSEESPAREDAHGPSGSPAEEPPNGAERGDHDNHAHGDAHADHEHEDDVAASRSDSVIHIPSARLRDAVITFVPVHRGTVKGILSIPAEIALDSDNEAHIVPRVPGIVREVHAGLGQEVEAGAVLAVLDSRELAHAKSEYLAALSARELAQATYNREKGLWEQKISAERDYIEAVQALRTAEIAVETAQQALHALGLDADAIAGPPGTGNASLTRYEVRAPFSGRVLARHVAIGEAVDSNHQVFHLARLDPVWALGRVPERDIARVRLGQHAIVSVDAYPGEEFTGTVDYIGSVLDPASRTVNVRVPLANPNERLRAGMFGRMLLQLDEHDHGEALLVPNDALQRSAGGAVVYKKVGEETLQPVPVTVLHASDTLTEVQGDLVDGNLVAAGDLFLLKSEASRDAMGGGHSH